MIKKIIDKFNRFVKPGELLFSNIIVQKFSYLEFINFKGIRLYSFTTCNNLQSATRKRDFL